MRKVLFILNHAPNYRNTFLKELSEHVDLTVMAKKGSKIGLKEPDTRKGYKYISVEEYRILGVNFNFQPFFEGFNNYDVIIHGLGLREPFILLNLLRTSNKKILFGHIHSNKKKEEHLLNKILFQWAQKKCDSFLVHTNYIKKLLQKETSKPIYSFNNTYFYESEIKQLPFQSINNGLNMIWIGRYLERPNKLRNINYLIDIARRNKNVNVRLIGTDMKSGLRNRSLPKNIDIYGEIFDDDILEKHFSWSHVVMNPGHLGLLAMNTARFGRPLIVGKNIDHAPEVQLPIDANQLFINFDKKEKVDKLIDSLVNGETGKLEKWGNNLAEEMKENYTIEHMISQFLKAIYT